MEHRFAVFFPDKQPSWSALCVEAWREVEEIFRTDVARKAQKLAEETDFSESVVPWMAVRANIQAVMLYRISRAIFLREGEHPVLDRLAFLMRATAGMEIYYTTEIGEAFTVNHGAGTVIGPRHRIGKKFTVYQGVTVGQSKILRPDQYVEIGDNVFLFAGAKVLGRLRIGNNVRVAANAVLLEDAEEGRTYAGIPAKAVA